MHIIIGAAVVTGIILLVMWPIAQWLRPARTYDLDSAHVSLALGRQRGSRAACWLAEQQLRKGRQAPGMADGLSVTARTGSRRRTTLCRRRASP